VLETVAGSQLVVPRQIAHGSEGTCRAAASDTEDHVDGLGARVAAGRLRAGREVQRGNTVPLDDVPVLKRSTPMTEADRGADDGDALHTSSSYMRQRSARWCHAAAQPLPS